MLRQGPIPLFVHGVLDYLLGALLIAAPFLFGFSDVGSATALAVIAGVFVLLSGASTDGLRTSLVKVLPLGAHIVLDYLLGALFIAAPFLFAFSGESAPTAFFIVLGVLALLITLATRWRPADTRTAL